MFLACCRSVARAVAEYRQSESHLRLLILSVIRSWAVQDALSRLHAQENRANSSFESRRSQSDDHSQPSTSSGPAGSAAGVCNQCGGRIEDEPVYWDSAVSSSSQQISTSLADSESTQNATEQNSSDVPAVRCSLSDSSHRGAKRSFTEAFRPNEDEAGPSGSQGATAAKTQLSVLPDVSSSGTSSDTGVTSDSSTSSADETESSQTTGTSVEVATGNTEPLTVVRIDSQQPSKTVPDSTRELGGSSSTSALGQLNEPSLEPARPNYARHSPGEAQATMQNMESFPGCLLEALARLQTALEMQSRSLFFYRNEAGAHLRERISVILERIQNFYNRNIDNIPVREIPSEVIESESLFNGSLSFFHGV